MTVSVALWSQEDCSCQKVDDINDDPEKIVAYLENSELNFSESLVGSTGNGIQQAAYFYCDDDQGYLFIKINNKERLYKDVPLGVWFEFKFDDTLERFYRSQIKYEYISI